MLAKHALYLLSYTPKKISGYTLTIFLYINTLGKDKFLIELVTPVSDNFVLNLDKTIISDNKFTEKNE